VTAYRFLDTPCGRLLLAARDGALKQVRFLPDEPFVPQPGWALDPRPLQPAVDQLNAYFQRRLTQFTLRLEPEGSPFQLLVWGQLLQIPYGATLAYSDLARSLGRPNASRAVGAANGANPIAILIPCHRVIGSAGSLTGYAGGLPIKRFLLDLESPQPALL
jgi:methylated-DNA-[protein]-cysteine S-methyltransferase